MFSLGQSNVGLYQDKSNYLEYKNDVWGDLEDIRSFDSFFYHTESSTKYQKENQEHDSLDFRTLDNICRHLEIPLFQSCNEDAHLSSLRILNKCGRGFKRLSNSDIKPEPRVFARKLSMGDILRLAGEKFMQISYSEVIKRSYNNHKPLLSLSGDQIKDVELVKSLLSAAEKSHQKRYALARKFLNQCDNSSSDDGDHVQRIVYYFCRALREKIDRETGRIRLNDSLKKQSVYVDEEEEKANINLLAFHQQTPLSQISLHAGVQAIVESVTGAKRVHVIDLEIRSGVHVSILMQALASRLEFPIELLKVTAVVTKTKSITEETGERLIEFAKSINLPFSFSVVMVSDIRDLSEHLLDLEGKETVVVNGTYALRRMLDKQDELESLMRLLKRINPCVMVVTEVEGKHNSPVFVNRFIEALFYFGAFFDCAEDCIGRDDPMRKKVESMFFGYGIRNMIVGGEERKYRHVNLDIWRAFFARFGMQQIELSSSLLLQARLVAKTYACWESCTIYIDENAALMVGWKGTPLQSVTAWRFLKSDSNSVN